MATSGRNRMTIAHALGLISLIALGLAALRNPTRLAADLLLDLAVVLTVTAAIVGACGRGQTRTFWAGFAIAASGYLLFQLSAVDISSHQRSATTRLLDACFEFVPKPIMTQAGAPPGEYSRFITRTNGERIEIVGTSPTPHEQAILDEYFQRIDEEGYRILGHAVSSVLAGIAGGAFGLLIASRHEPVQALRPTEPPEVAE